MIFSLRISLLTFLLAISVFAVPVDAILYPHDASNNVVCEHCHTSHQELGTRGYDNMCLVCHKPGSPTGARKFAFTPGDAANPFGTYTSDPPPGIAQTSHTWIGSDTLAKAGALPPKTFQMTKLNLVGALSCVKCHNVHAPRSSTTNSAPFLRMLNDRDQMCLDCHRPRNTRDTRKGTHPVNFNYTSATSLVKKKPGEFRAVPISSNPDNPTASMNLKNGALLCTTCHGAHYTDSDRLTFDSRTSILTPSPLGKGGYLLRTDLRGTNSASVNMCTNCHIKPSHNKRGQDVQCGDCHGGHVDEADGSVPNVYVVRRYMNISTQYGAVRSKKAFLQSTSSKNWRSNDVAKPGVCQACHEVPTGGIYPPEHTSTNGKVCMGCHVHNSSSGAFSASCNQCHGFPPALNVAGGPTGYAGSYFGDSGVSEANTPHVRHAGGAGDYSFGCSQCHQGNNHADGNFQDIFRDTTGVLGATAGAVPAYNPATRQCSNLYCHSNGAPRGGSLVAAAVNWPNGKGSITDCSACHAALPPTNAHSKHIFSGINCYQCHAATVDKDSFTTIADRTKHVNGGKDVAFANTSSTFAGGWDSTGAGCTNIYCHSQGTSKNPPFAAPLVAPAWTASLTCAGCHGAATSGTLSGRHTSHVDNAAALGTNNSLGCVECHAQTVSNNTTIATSARHVNRLKDYSGAKAGRNASCANFYCHSNGNGQSLAYVNPPAWNSGASLGCNGCHGTGNPTTGAPDYASGGAGSATANSHNRHVAGAGINDTTGCANCHSRTVDAAVDGKLRNYSTLHLNKSADVAFRLVGGKTGTYNTGTTQCSNTYCHGVAASPQWGLTVGVPLACNTCHAATAIDAGWSASSAHKLHWEDMVLPASYTLTPGNTSSDPTKYRFACSSCHAPGSSTAVHATGPAGANGAGQVYFGYTSATRKGTYSYGGATAGTDNGFAWTAGTNCNTTYCHSNGQVGAGAANGAAVTWSTTADTGCTACHGNATSNTLSGEHQAHVNNDAVLGTSFKCSDCHAKTVGAASDTVLSDKRNHVNKFRDYSGARAGRSAACTNFYCHSNGKGTFVNPPAWTAGSSLDCKGCHGATGGAFTSAAGEPNYTSGGAATATANSHQRHVDSAGDCVKCHQRTTSSGTAILAGATDHIDRTIDVRFSKVNGFTTYSGVYNSGGKTCSATYCHGGAQTSPAWGTAGPLACDTCHKASSALPAGHTIHFADAAVFTAYTATPGNRSSAGAYRFACSSCHGRNAGNHAGGPVAANSAPNIFFALSSAGKNPAWALGGSNNTDAQGFKYTTGVNGACNATYCHSNGQGGNGSYATLNWATPQGTIGCTGCHGDAVSGTLSGEHTAHVNNAAVFGTNNSYGCAECHAKTVSNNTTISTKSNHVNKFKDYSGAKANDSYNAGTKTCSSAYCHSNGNLRNIAYVNPPAWNAGASLGCNGCHGTTNAATGAPDYASGGASSTTANSHDRHVAGAGITDTKGCATCHYRTVSNAAAGALRNYSTLHLNKSADVAFKLLNGKTGTYDSANQQCSNTYCHGTAASPKWGLTAGVPLACNTCHSAQPDDAYWAANSAHKVHLEAAVLPSKYANYSGNVSSAGSYRFTCSSCHLPGSGKAVHSGGPAGTGAGQVFFGYTTPGRVGTYSYGAVQGTTDNGYAWTAGTNCTTSYCHSNGAGGNGSTAVVWTTASHNATTNTRCKTCHGYTTASGTAINTGSHGKHIGATYGLSCGKCHSLTTDGAAITDKSKHVNKVKNVAWDATNTGGTAYASPNCSGIYCHSAGTANVAPYAAPNMAVSWGGSLGTNCNGCHKGDKASGDPITRGSHLKHIANYGINCVKCHAATVSGTRTIATPGNHVNKSVTVAFNNSTTAVIGTAMYNGTVASTASPTSKVPGSANGQCTNTYCHSTVQGVGGVGAPTAYGTPTWGASQTCSTCHRGPVNHFGTAADGGNGVDLATGSHAKHLSYTFNFGGDAEKCTACHKWDGTKAFNDCNQCHNNAQMFVKHVNGQIDVAFDAAFGTGTYNGTAKPGDGYSTCANVYCHSNGTSVASGSIPANTTVNWGTAGPLACNACHGNPPAYANGTPKKNNHGKHGYTCDTCHYNTTTNGTTIASMAYHVNKTYDLAPKAGVTFTYTFNVAGGTCTNISCHGNNSAQWGTTLTCQGCHLSTADTDNWAADGAPAKLKNVGEWDTTGHGKSSGTYTSGNVAAAFTVANACLYCHDSAVTHNAAGNFFRLKNIADATWGKNGVCMNCHATGSAGITVDSVLKNGGKKVSAYHYGADHTALKNGGQFCWDCHDAHGDGNVYMIHNAVAKVSDATTGLPTTTANVTFTAFATGTDYAGANATKLCNACHTTASHYAGASGDGHNSGARCTGCHSHNNSDNKAYGFQAGESGGGSACGACHSDFYNADQTKYSMHSNVAGISYKHYLDNDAAVYSNTLPNGPSTNVTSRRCTMCHVDHDIFRVTATATAGRAFNIRPNASATPTSGSNTDLTNCVSCHYQVSTKAIAAPNAEDDSVSIPFPGLTFANATSIVKNSTHGYVVQSQEFADATRGTTTFLANCTKCHNDTIGKNNGAKSSYNAQDGTAGNPSRSRFGNHLTTNNNFYSVFSNNFFQGTASSATNVTNATITVAGAGWTVNQWTGYYVITTGGTGQNQRKMVTGNTATVLTLSGTFTTALDATTNFDIVQSPISTDNVCFACHSKRNQGKGARAGFDWYSSEHIKPALESLKDTFVILAQTGTVSSWTAGGSGVGPTVTDTSKSWTANQWQNYTVKFANGVVRKITSNTATVLTVTYNKKVAFAVSNGMAYEIFKPSYHPLDSYGRHDSIERVAPVKRTWNQGDMGKITATISTTSFKDDTRAWSANQWNGSTITFPKQGVTSTISTIAVDANGVPTVTFSPAVSGLAVGDPYYVGTRHVSCADCHNSHAAQPYPFGDVTTGAGTGTNTLQANDAKNPTGARKWVDNQWTGYLLKVRRATDNLEQIRYITAYNSTTGTFTVGLPWNTAISAGDDFWVITSDRWTSSGGQEGGRAGAGSAGVWGIQVGGFTAPAAGSFQNMTTATYAKIENVYDRTGSRGGNAAAGQRDMCVRCHSYYAWGRKPPTTTTPGPQSAVDAAVGPVLSTDVAQEFNPNNASHHAVYARGNNQPIRANYGNTAAGYSSWYNPNWPKYSTANGGDTVSMTNGTVTLAGTAALPRTALPGWYLYIGADSITATATAVAGTGTTANGTGFLEITSISSATSFTVRAVNSSGAWVANPTLTGSSANWFVTAGLGNAFIPPYGPWSVLICTDCHGSTKTDPLGPHASANDFLLKSLDTNIRFEWYDGSAIQSIQPNSKTATILDTNMGRQIFCWNCHRSDVYANSALHGAATRASMGRVPHDLFYCSSNTTPSSSLKLEAYPSTAMPPGWQVWCKHCHGGDKVGGTHGTNTTFATGDVAGQARKRFLNGATWVGYGKSTTTTTQTCYTQDGTSASASAVSQCGQHSGGRSSSINAIYNYW